MNTILAELFAADQADRMAGFLGVDAQQRDCERLEVVVRLLQAGAVQEGIDYFHAALLFQHGTSLEQIWTAYELAQQAAALGHAPARRLTAMAYGRWLVYQDLPQKYGTQYCDGFLCPIDPNTTDQERAAYDVEPLTSIPKTVVELQRRHRAVSTSTLQR